jgi:nucleotide-binding universal stress UspA family protein
MKILLAVDGSEYTQKMLDYVCSHQGLFDASHSYTVLNTQTPLPPHARSALSADMVNDFHADEARKVLEPAAATLARAGLKAQTEWKAGPAGETIAQFAEQGRYDMVIMGSHGHGSFGKLVMGSVSTNVLAHCGVPVLLIR